MKKETLKVHTVCTYKCFPLSTLVGGATCDYNANWSHIDCRVHFGWVRACPTKGLITCLQRVSSIDLRSGSETRQEMQSKGKLHREGKRAHCMFDPLGEGLDREGKKADISHLVL